MGSIQPLLLRGARTVAARNRKLLAEARIDVEDLAQEVARKLFRSPPSQRGGEAVIVGWAKVTARRHLLDLAAKRGRETTLPETDTMGRPSTVAERFDARALFRQLELCAEELNERYFAAYQLLLEDPEMPRLEMAVRLGELKPEQRAALEAQTETDPRSALVKEAQKAQARAWKLVSRVRTKLAECLDRHQMLELLPETLQKLRQKGSS